MANNKIILDYGDYLIRESDMQILNHKNTWLNDTLIGFYFEYLRNEIYPESQGKIKLFGPEVSQCIKMGQSGDMPAFLGEVTGFDLLIWALNDEEQTEVIGGSHWSLLAYSASENLFYHFDSSSGHNKSQARALHTKLSNFVGKNPNLIDAKCETQINGHDCGCHTIRNAELVADHFLKIGSIEGVKTASPAESEAIRGKMIDLINLLKTT